MTTDRSAARAASAIIVLLAAACVLPACSPTRSGPYAPQTETLRDPAQAQRLALEAAAILDALATRDEIPSGAPGHAEHRAATAAELARAESILRAALSADLYCGPAHNNLGVVYLTMSPPRLYEAASEFEFARKLMPGHPDPRVNLALALERAGKPDDAIAACRSALDARPGHLPAIQALARTQIKHRRATPADPATRALLEDLALRSDPAWANWARVQLAKADPPR